MTVLTEEYKNDLAWVLHLTLHSKPSQGEFYEPLLLGLLSGIAYTHPEWTFWQVLHEARTRLEEDK